MEFYKFAAIDIGSNAVRLLIMNVIPYDQNTIYHKVSLIRVPIRLGKDVFQFGEIREQCMAHLMEAMRAFKLLMGIHQVMDVRTCATSAMREASNSKVIIEMIRNETGIDVELITGDEEAQIIFSTEVAEYIDPEHSCLYIDLGGGSTELTVFADRRMVDSHSFDLGTVRVLQKGLDPKEWDELKNWVKNIKEVYNPSYIIGSGGNIIRIAKLLGSYTESILSFTLEQFNDIVAQIKSLTTEERMIEMGMSPDRADVIIPASEIFGNIMEWSGINKVYVPKGGLSDGIVRELFKKHHTTSLPPTEMESQNLTSRKN
ncbi:MAG: exopolyphosphatase [Bacteroidetes bacterium]|nr:exopolyphosphatase [Bacteroidota bacterium]